MLKASGVRARVLGIIQVAMKAGVDQSHTPTTSGKSAYLISSSLMSKVKVLFGGMPGMPLEP